MQTMWISYHNYAPISNHSPRIPGNISMIKISHEEKIVLSFLASDLRVSGLMFPKLVYLCNSDLTYIPHVSCQHHWGLVRPTLTNQRPALGCRDQWELSNHWANGYADNETFLQILFPSLGQPGRWQQAELCVDWNQRNWSLHVRIHVDSSHFRGVIKVGHNALNWLCEFISEPRLMTWWIILFWSDVMCCGINNPTRNIKLEIVEIQAQWR